MADDPEQPDFEKFKAEAREYAAAKNREKQGETRFASTRTAQRDLERPDNPLRMHERHQQENGRDQERRIRAIADADRRQQVRTEVAEHYTAWGKALSRAYSQRYENSPRLYSQKIAALKVSDERLIPKDRREDLRQQAIREAMAQSNERMKELNTAMPRKIDRIINEAAKLPPYRPPLDKNTQRAKDAAAQYKARAAKAGRDRDRDLER
jgi:hypothetical protein